MKKLALIFSILIIISCSSNDERSSSSTILLKKIVSHNYNGTYETIFSYDGKKLLEAKSDRQRKEFTYEGDKIVKIKWFQNPNKENLLLHYVDFEYYPDGRLKGFKKYLDAPVIVDFTYNSDNSVNFSYNTVYNQYYNFTGILKIENNEVSKFIFVNSNSQSMGDLKFNYDDKNHPLKNVTGYDKLLLYNYFYPSMHYSGFSTSIGNNHNFISQSVLSNPSNISVSNVFEYNNSNFPISINKNDISQSDFLFY